MPEIGSYMCIKCKNAFVVIYPVKNRNKFICKRCKKEFEERTGGGTGGSNWVAPLLPKDFKAPVDMRWPEYVTTERGEEWWIPTSSA